MVNPVDIENPFATTETAPVQAARQVFSPTSVLMTSVLFTAIGGGVLAGINCGRLGEPVRGVVMILLGVVWFPASVALILRVGLPNPVMSMFVFQAVLGLLFHKDQITLQRRALGLVYVHWVWAVVIGVAVRASLLVITLSLR